MQVQWETDEDRHGGEEARGRKAMEGSEVRMRQATEGTSEVGVRVSVVGVGLCLWGVSKPGA
jgi:hypothetical protein